MRRLYVERLSFFILNIFMKVRTLLLEQTDIVSKDIKMLPKYFGVLNKLELYNCNMNSETVSALANGISGSSNPVSAISLCVVPKSAPKCSVLAVRLTCILVSQKKFII